MKKYAIIVAAGSGSRMNSQIPKQFMLLKGKPILYYTLQAFLDSYEDLEVVLVLSDDYMDMGKEIIDGFFDSSRIRITIGGRTRFHSVQNGLALVEEESVIFVHDGVRCLVSQDLIRRCFDAALEFGTAIPGIECKDSMRLLVEEGEEIENEALDRNRLRIIQTPQTFHSKLLLSAFLIDYKEKFTDEASVVEAFGMKLHLVEGEETNIKITTPVDLLLAEQLVQG